MEHRQKHHWSENSSSPHWKDYTFWLQTYSQQVSVEWISLSISKAVYSCIMLKEGQNYETSGQLLGSLVLNNFSMEKLVPFDSSYLPEGTSWTKNKWQTWSCCIQWLEISNQFWLWCLWHFGKIHHNSWRFLAFLGSNMIPVVEQTKNGSRTYKKFGWIL